jgi:hypothetical protein
MVVRLRKSMLVSRSINLSSVKEGMNVISVPHVWKITMISTIKY